VGNQNWAKRRDKNEAEIVRELKRIGATVSIVDQPCDLIVGWRGLNWLFEVKDPTNSPAGRKLTPPQAQFHNTWRGQISVIHYVEDAMEIMTRD
jgi:hypothetical protein